MTQHSIMLIKQLNHSLLIARLVAIIIASLALPTAADNSPIPMFKANYQADIKGFRVKATRELTTHTNGEQSLRFKATSMIASMEEHTRFNWEEGRLQALQYSYRRNVIGKEDVRDIHFDHNQKSIRSSGKAIAYSPDVLDNLSYQLQLQQDLRQNKSNLSYSVISKSGTKQKHFKRSTEELLETPLGTLRTVKVSLARDNNKRETYIWFAKDWDYTLVRFEQFEKGKKEFVINLTSATLLGKAITGL